MLTIRKYHGDVADASADSEFDFAVEPSLVRALDSPCTAGTLPFKLAHPLARRGAVRLFELPKETLVPGTILESVTMEKRERGIWFWTGILVAILGLLILAGVAWRTLS